MVESVDAAISRLPFMPKTLVLSASGSFLDPWEVPVEARTGILECVARRLPAADVVLETHATTVTYDALAACVAILGVQRTEIEFGLECVEPSVLRYCLNKQVTLSAIRRALSVVALFPGLRVNANVLVGIPLLTVDESIRSAQAAVEWAFRQGVDRCVLFPVNIRAHTFAHWLCSRGLWSAPTLWDLVDVLTGLPASELERVDIAWFAPYRQASLPAEGSLIEPTTCPLCYDHVVDLFKQYADRVDRVAARNALAGFECACRTLREVWDGGRRPLGVRLLEACEAAACEVLGPQAWETERSEVTVELAGVNEVFREDAWENNRNGSR